MAEADPQLSKPTATKRSDFERERMRVHDAFTKLESAASRLKPSRSGASFGQALTQLNDLLASDVIERARELNDVRNDMVHSEFRMIPGNPARAVYLNFADEGADYPVARMLTLEHHRALARDISQVTAELLKITPAK